MTSLGDSLFGMRIYIDDQLGVEYHREQFRFPRSKKKRIRTKWTKQSKNYRSWTTQKPKAYKVNGSLVMNSIVLSELKKSIR